MLKNCVVFLLIAAVPVFSQNEGSQRGQGFLTLDPYWRQALGGAVLSLPSVQAQSAVVALDGGNIKAYSTAGNPMWNYSARGRISPYITRSREGTSYFSRTNGTLIAVNRAGRELWRRSLGSPLCAGVVIGWDGRLFVPTDKKLFCYTASGTLLWTRTFESSFLTAPKLDHSGNIIFALENNEVYRVDPFGNAHVWTTSSSPAVLLPVGQGEIMAIYNDGTIEVLGIAEEWYMAAHQIERHSSIMPKLPAGPLAAVNRGDNIAAALTDGRIVLVSINERRILWEGNSHIREFSRGGRRPEMEAEILYDERGIYILSKEGATGFSHDGGRLWYILLENAAAIPAFGDDGVLYSGGRDWILYAYKIEDRTASGGIYGSSPQGSYRMGTPQPSLMPDIPLFEDEVRTYLEQIDNAISTGRVASNEAAWTTFLLTTSANHENVQIRISALNLLGKIGSRDTIPWLANIFRRETEPLLKAAAASAIGAIGVDPEGIAIQTFLHTIIQTPGLRDEQVLIALTSATGALCRFSGPPLSETGIRILNLLTESSYPSIVRRHATRELSSLR